MYDCMYEGAQCECASNNFDRRVHKRVPANVNTVALTAALVSDARLHIFLIVMDAVLLPRLPRIPP